MSKVGANTIEALKKLVLNGARTKESAYALESVILDEFDEPRDDPRFEDLLLMIASFVPEGGDYLYDSRSLIDECLRVLRTLEESAG